MKRTAATAADWDKVKVAPVAKDIPNLPAGIYHGIPFVDYTRIDAISRSGLSKIKQSLAHFRYVGAGEETPSLAFGTLCHHGRLEPEVLSQRYVVIPETLTQNLVTGDGKPTTSKNSSMYKERLARFLEAHPGKQEVSQEWMDNLGGVLRSIKDHPKASWLFDSGMPEVTLVWVDPITGVRCKARVDWVYQPGQLVTNWDMLSARKKKSARSIPHEHFRKRILTDLKTTQDCVDFYLDKWDYHLQAAMYQEGWFVLTGEMIPFWFVAAESKAPHAVRAAPTSSLALEAGRNEFKYLTNLYKLAKEAKHWPGPHDPDFWTVKGHYRFDVDHLDPNHNREGI